MSSPKKPRRYRPHVLVPPPDVLALDLRQAAHALNVSPNLLSNLVRDGKIKPVYFRSKPLFPRALLDALLKKGVPS